MGILDIIYKNTFTGPDSVLIEVTPDWNQELGGYARFIPLHKIVL